MIDFVVEWIPDFSINIDKKQYKKLTANGKEIVRYNNTNSTDIKLDQSKENEQIDIDKLQKGKFEKYEIKKLVNMLSNDRLKKGAYSDWLNVGMCLKNINSDYLEIWDRWSEKGEGYDVNCCENKWKTFNKNSDKKLGIGSLIKWANDDNKDELKKFLSERNIRTIIKTNKKQFPDNELDINNIVQNDEFHYVGLNDKFCPLLGAEHKESGNMYLEFICPDKYYMKCHECVGKAFPCKHIKLKNTESKNIFNTLIVNNYYNEQENLDFDVVEILKNVGLNKLVFDILNCPSDKNYAKVAHYLHPNKYIYDVDTWYEFKNHRWFIKKGKNTEFKSNVFEEICGLMKCCIEYYKDDKKAVTYIKKLIKNVEDDNTRKNIINLMTEEFSYSCSKIDLTTEEGEFYKKMDKNPYLLCFTNGIYDFKKLEFRDGTPEDFISLTVGYAYIDKHTKKINDIKKFFEDIQPDKEQREYLLTFLGSCLLGTQKDEIYSIFTGATRNGKTTCMELLNLTLSDDYYETMESTFLTRPSSDAGKPVPELLNLEKKRVVCTSENDANASLNTGVIKGRTGGDPIGGRLLQSNKIIRFKPQFKLISLFNDIPSVDKLDSGFWSRCKVVHFPTTFVATPKDKNELPIDKELKYKITDWKQDFMLLLIEYCKKYIKNGLKFPKSVEQQTEKYKKSVDCYDNYIGECLEKDDGNAVSWKEIKSHFCCWYKDNIDEKVPNAKEIKKNFIKNFKYDIKNNRNKDGDCVFGWKNWKFVNE